MTSSITPAIGQDRIDAGPATVAAFRAPNSQPEPMTLPRAKNVSPITPTPRRRLRSAAGVVVIPVATSQLASGQPRGPRLFLDRHGRTLPDSFASRKFATC